MQFGALCLTPVVKSLAAAFLAQNHQFFVGTGLYLHSPQANRRGYPDPANKLEYRHLQHPSTTDGSSFLLKFTLSVGPHAKGPVRQRCFMASSEMFWAMPQRKPTWQESTKDKTLNPQPGRKATDKNAVTPNLGLSSRQTVLNSLKPHRTHIEQNPYVE